MAPFGRLDEDAILAVLDALSHDSTLLDAYVLKGGNALRFAYEGQRYSTDIDLTTVESKGAQEAAVSEAALAAFCDRLDGALAAVAANHGYATLAVQSRRVLPSGRDHRTFPAFQVSVGYSTVPDRRPPFSETIRLDVTLNDIVCESEYVEVGGVEVHVSSLDDILAEKLRALLQQVPRRRNRPSDVYDVWYYVTRARPLLDPARIGVYLVEKSDGKEGLERITAALFQNPEVRERASTDYGSLAGRLRGDEKLPPFEDAFRTVLAFVGELGLPDA